MRIVIMIPTYNEFENISKLLDELLKLTKSIKKHTFTILVVDDKSPDGTGNVVKNYAQKHSNIKLLSGNKAGLGNAMIRGYLYSMKTFKPDAIVTNEADFGFSFSHLPYMLNKLEEGFDVVIASRHVPGGFTKGWTLTRKLNHWIANTVFASWVAGVSQIGDHNGAFRAIRVRGVLDSIGLDKTQVAGFGFFFYLAFKLTQVTERIHEFPTTFTFRTVGESKVSFNPKYLKTYFRDVREYISLSFKIRQGGV